MLLPAFGCRTAVSPLVLDPSRRRFSTTLLVAEEQSFDAAAALASAFEGGLTLVAGFFGLAVIALGIPLALWLINQQYVLELRRQRFRSATSSSKSKSVERGSPGYLPPRELWTTEELRAYDGTNGADGPILLAADGLVFNVARSRNFYGPGGEYHVMAGADATRYLARNSVEAESTEQAARPLNVAQRAALAAWLFSLKQRYDVIGRLAMEGEVEARRAAAERRSAYLDRMEELSASMEASEARELLQAAWDAPDAREGE